MAGLNDIVITGLGCVTPIGIGRAALRESLLAGHCGIRRAFTLNDKQRTTYYAASVEDFDAKQYVTPRKALKVMSREVQIAYAAAHLAWQDANLTGDDLHPARMGVIYGSEMIPGDHAELVGATRACVVDGQLQSRHWGQEFAKQIYPLWMLKNLPNMPACHVGIAIDAQGPNNTIAQEEVGGLLALIEAAMIIDRDHADLMVVGGVGSRVTPTRQAYRLAKLYNQHGFDAKLDQLPQSRPFDIGRRGVVSAEGAGALVLERRSHAVRRHAKILACVKGFTSRCAKPTLHFGGSHRAIASAASFAIQAAGIQAADLNHVCAQGYSQSQLDIEEAQAIAAVAPNTPVSAFSSYLGTAGAASGILELSASLIAMQERLTLPTLGHTDTDPKCPIRVVQQTSATTTEHFLKLGFTSAGHAAAVVLECEN